MAEQEQECKRMGEEEEEQEEGHHSRRKQVTTPTKTLRYSQRPDLGAGRSEIKSASSQIAEDLLGLLRSNESR